MNKYVNAMRQLAIQSIKRAKQGHPGMAISAAPLVYSVYTSDFKLSRKNPLWINRDRFVLSAGHGCMSLYPLLHFCKIISMAEMKRFRLEDSLTPGHPENNMTPHVDASTGPLGQGVAIAVGMAIAEAHLRAEFEDLKGLIDHYTYVVVGDGDLQEGISYEAMSLAGKLSLGKLIMLHDSNAYQLESSVKDVNIEDLKLRVQSMGWNYLASNNDVESIKQAIASAKKQTLPTFIEVKTIIGEGLEVENSFEAHGAVINDEEYKSFLDYWNLKDNDFKYEDEIYDHFNKEIIEKGDEAFKKWQDLLVKYQHDKPNLTNKFMKQVLQKTYTDIQPLIDLNKLKANVATRISAKEIMEILAEQKVNDIFAISADISKSTNIAFKGISFNDDYHSNFLKAGIREFAISGIETGMLLHSGLRVLSSTFLAFSDYMKPGIRLGAISEVNAVYVFTHDSVLLGSDGPTHQPVEQLASLRTIPHVQVIRPADQIETAAAFKVALSSLEKTYCLILTRQNIISTGKTSYEKTINEGGYIIKKAKQTPDLIFLASGSELSLCLEISQWLDENTSLTSSVYSVPNLNLFLEQKDLETKLESKLGLVAIEASNDPTWYKLMQYNHHNFLRIEVNEFGKSMDGLYLYESLGFSVKKILMKIRENFKLHVKDYEAIDAYTVKVGKDLNV